MKQWLGVAVVVAVAARAQTAEACQCGEFYEDAATNTSDLVFDGWVVGEPTPWKCAVPPAPKVKAGCIAITLVDPTSCEPYAAMIGIEGLVVEPEPRKDKETAATFCGLKPGKYRVRGADMWGGRDEDGTTAYGRSIDVVPGGSYVLFAGGQRGQELTVAVTRAVKGEVPREVKVKGTMECCVGHYSVGMALRFFIDRQPDGTLAIKATRDLTDADKKELVTVPAPPKPAEPAPQPAKKSGGCATSAPSSLWLTLLALALLRRRKR